MRLKTQSLFTLMMAAVLMMSVGCAASLSNLQRAEQQYQIAEAEKKEEEEKAKAAQAQADTAALKEAGAGRELSTALLTDAEEKIAMVEGVMARAEAQRQRACVLNPQLDFCKKAESPVKAPVPPQQPAATPPPADPAPAPVPPPQAVPPEQPPHVDVRMDDFTAAGMHRLTPLPVGWEVGFDATKGNIYLEVDGVRKYERSKPAQFKPGICYRFKAETVEACPAPPPPAP